MQNYQQGWKEIHQKQQSYILNSLRESMSRNKIIMQNDEQLDYNERAEDDAVDLAIDEYKLNK